MKYCLKYTNKATAKYVNEADEIIIKFNRKKSAELIKFVQSRGQTIIIDIEAEDIEDFIKSKSIALFNALKEKEADFRFRIPTYNKYNEEYMKLFNLLKEYNHRFFFNTYVNDWDTLYGYAAMGPTDMYITEDLGFEIEAAAAILHPLGIQIRCFPNVAQSRWNDTNGLKKFFIRPEDISKYEPYVDTFEFYNQEKQETYYRVYAVQGKWAGNLNELIIDLNLDIDNRSLLENFADKRTKCGKRCLKGRPCQICEAMYNLSKTLSDHNVMLRNGKVIQLYDNESN